MKLNEIDKPRHYRERILALIGDLAAVDCDGIASAERGLIDLIEALAAQTAHADDLGQCDPPTPPSTTPKCPTIDEVILARNRGAIVGAGVFMGRTGEDWGKAQDIMRRSLDAAGWSAGPCIAAQDKLFIVSDPSAEEMPF